MASNSPNALTCVDLIQKARQNPPVPILQGLLSVGDVALIHGTEECFKSVFMLQIAEAIASATPLVRFWQAPAPKCVGLLETEMSVVGIGERLSKMFASIAPPNNLFFFSEEALKVWRRQSMDAKFLMLERWVKERGIEVLLIDTVNDFFRGNADPSQERDVGKLFDLLRNLPVQARIIVRHNRKRGEHDEYLHSNELTRGSAEFKEDPEVLLNMERRDRRTHEVTLSVGKMRYGVKPDPLDLWFDASTFRLTPLPPVVDILLTEQPLTRETLLHACEVRFSVGQRKADDSIKELSPYLLIRQAGHRKAFALDMCKLPDSPWARFVSTS